MAQQNELAPNTTAYHQGRLAYVPDNLLPPELAGPILDKVQESSVIVNMGERIPVSYNGTAFPVTTRYPAAGQVGVGTTNAQREGYRVPLSGMQWDSKIFRPIKLGTIVTASKELVRSNPMGLFSQMRDEMAKGIGRSLDMAIVHGIDCITGVDLLGIDADNVMYNVANEVVYNYGDNVYDDLIEAYELVVNTPRTNFTKWAMDERFRIQLLKDAMERDTSGNPMSPGNINVRDGALTAIGFPVTYARAIGGDLDAGSLTDLLAVGGDFGMLRWGMADEVEFDITDNTTLSDGTNSINTWQTGQVAVKVTCTFGWILGDPDSFVKVTRGTTS